MHRIDGPGAVAERFVDQDPASGLQSTVVTDDIMNAIVDEIVGVVIGSGQILDKNNNNQLQAAIGGRGMFRNHAMNGLMKVAQRYPQNTVKQFFGVTPTKGYVLDRWLCDPGGSGICSISWKDLDLLSHMGQDQAGLPLVDGKLPVYMAWTQNSPGGGVREPRLIQRIPDVRTLAGETVTLSFYARLAQAEVAGFDQFSMELVQNWGTGGTPSAEISYTSPTFEINQSFSMWGRYTFTTTLGTVQGQSFGTNDDSFLEIKLKLGDGGEVFPLVITGIQLERGAGAGALETTPFEVELDRCQSYWEQSYPYGVTFGTATLDGADHAHESGAIPFAAATRFRREKAKVPTVEWFAPSSGAAASVDWGGVVLAVAAGANTSRAGTGTPGSTSHGSGADHLQAHWTAEAEI